jgi:acetoacetate decarboxylase
MNEPDVREQAFAEPLTAPAYPPGPDRFVNREDLIITDRTDAERLRALAPQPFKIDEPLVRYELCG